MPIYIATIGAPTEIEIETIDSDPYIVEIVKGTPATIESINQTVQLSLGKSNCIVDFNQLNLGTDVIGILPIIHGGTGTDTGSIHAPGALEFESATDTNITLITPGTGLTEVSKLKIGSLNGLLTATDGVVSTSGAFSVSAADVTYVNDSYPSLTNVKEALDLLLYVTPVVVLTNTTGTVEMGVTVTDIVLDWTVNKTIESQSMNNSIGTISPSTLRTYTHSGQSLTTDRTYTITVDDGTTTATSSSSVLFRNKRYWGVSASTTLSNSAILALTSEFATSRTQSRTFDCTGGRYFYFAYPARFGAATFTVGGLAFSDVTLMIQDFTNASGYTESYYVYRPNNIQTGAAISVVIT